MIAGTLEKMSPLEFDRLTGQIWQQLLPLIPHEMQKHFDKIRILIEDSPPPELMEELSNSDLAEDPDDLCGLHIGTSLPQTSLTYPNLFPARVYLFRRALLNEAAFDGSPAGLRRLREEIAVTLLHEIGHFFGLEEDDLERLGFD